VAIHPDLQGFKLCWNVILLRYDITFNIRSTTIHMSCNKPQPILY
jgi:hypothetical protein